MSEKVSLKAMRCPTCGANLKAENNTDAIVCVYCGNTIVPVNEPAAVVQNEPKKEFSGVLRVEGIKTSSSALAYIELFFEEYDWEAFAYAQTLSVAEIDKLAASLKSTSADDKNTWFVCFNAISIPFIKKIEGCKQLLDSVIEEYKNDNLDAYSKFDAYKRISTMISVSKSGIVTELERIIDKATKYGATITEISGLKAELDNIKNAQELVIYSDLKNIPEIKTLIAENNARIVKELASEGINAEQEYKRAQGLINEKKFVEALDVLWTLTGYSDVDELIDKIDRRFEMPDVFEIAGKLYYTKKSEIDTYSIYPTSNGIIEGKSIVDSIKKIIINYADVLYYIDYNNYLKKYNLSTNENIKLYDKSIVKDQIFNFGYRVYLLANRANGYDSNKKDIIELDCETGVVKVFLEEIKEMVSLTFNKMTYKKLEKKKASENSSEDLITVTNIVNVDTMETVELGTKNVSVKCYVNGYVVYTQESPNKYNHNLYIKSFNSNEPEILIEQNIYEFCSEIGGKLFYYVGNARNKTLININLDGSERREWARYISKVLFIQGDWLYFIRTAGYNSILCKSHLDGSKFSIIAADIDKFIELKNGYLYYINDISTLVKVRMDGSNLQELCDDVEDVLAVKEDKIIFVSIDGKAQSEPAMQSTSKLVKSLYAVDFSGSGKIKLAYNIKYAREYDENTVYYVAAEEIKSSYTNLDNNLAVLYKLDVETNRSEKLLELQFEIEESKLSGFTVAMIIMAIAFLFGFIGFCTEAIGLGVVGLIIAMISLIVGLIVKSNQSE